jgi:glutamine synthetase
MSIPDTADDVMAEYCWIDAIGGVRSKTRTLPKSKLAKGPGGLPEWNYDGSSTDQVIV